jgi:hypothetical protein
MAIRAADNALGNFGLSLPNAFCTGNVNGFVIADVVEVQSCRVRVKPAINASGFCLEFVKPSANSYRAIIRLFVDTLAIAGLIQPSFSPSLTLKRVIRSVPRFLVGLSHLVGISLAPPLCGCVRGARMTFSPTAGGFASACSLLISTHHHRMTQMECEGKPDIFAATYERVDD